MFHLDLFAGVGGFSLACQWNGIETIGFVEIDKYCQKVLRKHWPTVPIVEDIRDVEKIKEIVANATGKGFPDRRGSSLAESGREKPESKRCRSSPNGIQDISGGRNKCPESPAILVTAGFPCQPFSVAGKQLSQADDRYLWPQTIAVIKAIKPRWILLENVTGIINLALDTVLSDLEGTGYATETLIIPACAVNAWHRRDRVWVVAYSNARRCERILGQEIPQREDKIKPYSQFSSRNKSGNTILNKLPIPLSQGRESWQQTEPERGQGSGRGSQETIANSSLNGLEGEKPVCEVQQPPSSLGCSGEDWWAVEPELGRVAYGIPYRVDRLKCLGNAIVPQVAYEIIKVISMTGGVDD